MSEYIRVIPTQESLDAIELAGQIASTYHLNSLDESSGGLLGDMNPFKGPEQPTFEFLIATGEKDTEVEFYYGADEGHLDTIEDKLTIAYPSSFDIERVDIDVEKKLTQPEEYEPEEYVQKFKDGQLLHKHDTTGTDEDISGQHLIEEETQLSEDDIFINKEIKDDELEDLPILKESAELEGLQPLTKKDSTEPVTNIEGPAWTDDGTILARPATDYGTPIAVRWNGVGTRKSDWMTTISMFTQNHQKAADPEIEAKATLSNLIQHMVNVDHPLVFQVLFKPYHDWTAKGKKRKNDLQLDKDTLTDKISYHMNDLLSSNDPEVIRQRKRDRKRNYFDEEGESSRKESSQALGNVSKRAEMIDNKFPHKTFLTSVRAATIVSEEGDVAEVKGKMRNLSSVLDHLGGYFYGPSGEVFEDTGGLRNGSQAKGQVQKLLKKQIEWETGEKMPSLILNGDELCNFVAVPSGKTLTAEGARGTRSEARTRNPLARPHADMMRHFHVPGLRIGYAKDEEAKPEPIPTRVPPKLLPLHFARFATTGAGKSKAIINDTLSEYENTSGPTILIDPKGDGMISNYLRSHYERFGLDDLKENVIHFPVPDILPGFSFFNIEPNIENGQRRVDAIQKKANQYEEMLKIVMGRRLYNESKVAPIIMKSLIKALFDKEHGKHRDGRESSDKFSHHHFERAADEMERAVMTNGEHGSFPNVEDERLHEVLTRFSTTPAKEYQTLSNAVFNRLDYIRSNTHLQKIFDNTERKFDFRDHLDDNKVILFDLGDLEDDATQHMTALILVSLWDALQDADQTKCTKGHKSPAECREQAEGNHQPPCRKEWDENHVVNLNIDEAASISVSNIMIKMLEQGRSFHLGLGLSMQFPEQMKEGGDRLYRNVLNNIGTILTGRIKLDEEIASALAHEDVDAEDFRNRIKSLPRGEWIVQLPSPQFKETGPTPFSLDPLNIPSGHPESTQPLSESGEDTFQHYLHNVVNPRTQSEYGVKGNTDEQNGVSGAVSSDDGDAEGSSSPDIGSAAGTTAGDKSTASETRTDESPVGINETSTQFHSDSNTEDSQQKASQHESSGRGLTKSGSNAPESVTDPSESDPYGFAYDIQGKVDTEESTRQKTTEDNSREESESETSESSSAEKTSAAPPENADQHRNDPLDRSQSSDEPAQIETTQEHNENLPDGNESIASEADTDSSKDEALGDGGMKSEPVIEKPDLDKEFSDSQPVFEQPSDEGSKSNSNNSPATGSNSGESNIQPQHCGLSQKEINKRKFAEDELNFLYTVVEAMNGTLDGYNLSQPMTAIEKEFDVDVEKLEDQGLVKIHRMSGHRKYFTVTTAGQEACNNTKREGPGVGDRGGHTPHRVGCELAIQYLEQKPKVETVKSFVPIDQSSEKRIDVVGIDEDGETIYAIEVEGGKTIREGGKADNRPGINDYKSLEKDYKELCRAKKAEKIWIVRNGEIAARVLKALNTRGKTDIVNPNRIQKEARVRFNADRVQGDGGGEGMDKILTYDDVRQELKK